MYDEPKDSTRANGGGSGPFAGSTDVTRRFK
jgi:hypothetical protein